QGAAEMGLVGEDREGRRPALLVGVRDLRRCGPGPDLPGARGAALELGDQREAGPRQRLTEGTLLRALRKLPLELLQRNLPASALRARPRSAHQLFDQAHLVRWTLARAGQLARALDQTAEDVVCRAVVDGLGRLGDSLLEVRGAIRHVDGSAG